MKKIQAYLKYNQGNWSILPGVSVGQVIDGSRVLKGHGLDNSQVRTKDNARHIAQQIVDTINAAGGIEITNLEYAYRTNDCHKGFHGCDCGAFDDFKE